MGLISRVSSRTYRKKTTMTETEIAATISTEPEQKTSAWGDLLTNIISGKTVEEQSDSDSGSEDEERESEDEHKTSGVVDIAGEEKAKRLRKRQEAEALSSDEDESTVGKKNENARKHREWEMIGRVMHPSLTSAKEKKLRRNARIGVVQLFTAVRAHQSKLIKKQKGGNIQQRTTRVDETRDEFEHLLKKKNHEEDEPTTESKWSALQGGNEAGEEDDWMD